LSRWQSRYKVEILPHFPAQKIRRLNCAPVQPTVAKLLMDNEKTSAKKKYSKPCMFIHGKNILGIQLFQNI